MATYGIVIGMSDIQNPLHSTYRLVLYGKKMGKWYIKEKWQTARHYLRRSLLEN